MNYQQSREYVCEAQAYAGEISLTNICELMNRLGNPQDSLRFVHVSGTNGKGSVIAYLYETLKRAGYHVGRYISPSVYTYREKLEVDGMRITREEFAAYVTRIAGVIDDMTAQVLAHPTPFEIETAAAFLFFADKKCDLAIMEVGMGGIDDATNIIRTTELAVITPVSLEHQMWLGNTLAEIAGKKAGIIKKGCSVIAAKQESEAESVIEAKAAELGCPLSIADPESAKILREDIHGQKFLYKEKEYEISLAGACQISNAVEALEALEALNGRGFPTSYEQRAEGLSHTHWDGRLTVLREHPLFVIDGAHNPAAAAVLEESVQRYLREKKLYFIMGVFADKDYNALIQRMCPYASEIVAIETPDNPRALPAQELADAIRPVNSHVQAKKSIPDAVQYVFENAGSEDAILAFGSLSFLGELTRSVEEWEERNK